MKFTDFEVAVQERVKKLLSDHIARCAQIIPKDGGLLPMMFLPDTRKLIGLQSSDGQADVDRAYAYAVKTLKGTSFSYALFSYSTQINFDGKTKDALKTCIFLANGVEFSFFTPYKIKGLFKKSIAFENSVLSRIKESVFY